MSRFPRRVGRAAPFGGAALLLAGAALFLSGTALFLTGTVQLYASEGIPVVEPAIDPGLGAAAHADGPPLAKTGGFGEGTCRECHMDLELNSPLGELSVDGIPTRFEPGATYVVTILLSGEGMGRAGFQGAFRFGDGDREGAPAGEARPLDERTTVRTEGGVDYVHHTEEGSRLNADEFGTWSFEWIAPRGPGPVVFNVAANSANGDNSPFGDLIYAAEEVSTASETGPEMTP